MMQEVEVLKTIQELICSFFSEEQFTLSSKLVRFDKAEISRISLQERTAVVRDVHALIPLISVIRFSLT